MATPRGLANLSLSFSGSLARSLTDPPDATEWNNSNLRALIDLSGVVISTSVLSKRGGDSPLPPDSLVPPSEEANADGVRGVVSGDHNACLEGEGESFPSLRPSMILRLSSGSGVWLLPLRGSASGSSCRPCFHRVRRAALALGLGFHKIRGAIPAFGPSCSKVKRAAPASARVCEGISMWIIFPQDSAGATPAFRPGYPGGRVCGSCLRKVPRRGRPAGPISTRSGTAPASVKVREGISLWIIFPQDRESSRRPS
ncbi:hypothetical protein AAC387_Pa03g1780 [Persea americana]